MEVSAFAHINANVTCLIQPGKRHLSQAIECEDTTFFIETPTLRYYGLADGQSGKQYCKIGGESVLKSIASYIKGKGLTQLHSYGHTDEIQYEITKLMRCIISELSVKHSAKAAEFSSTVVVFALNPQTREYMYVHLGDGGIIGKKRSNSLSLISAPENGITTQYTWLTTSLNALLHLKVGFGNIDYYDRILLFTDGASAICRGKNIPKAASRLILGENNHDDIARYIEQSNPHDDASCIIIDFEKSEKGISPNISDSY
ncbi:MAG: protein phosphatase 2C domain-containing protein [Christensenella sp.]